VGAADTIFDVERRASLDGPLPRGHRPLAIIGINLREPAETELLLLGNAGIANPLRAEIVAMPVGQARPDQLRQAFGQWSEARLALVQRLLGPLAVRDVMRHLRKTSECTACVTHGSNDALDAIAGPDLAHSTTLLERLALLTS